MCKHGRDARFLQYPSQSTDPPHWLRHCGKKNGEWRRHGKVSFDFFLHRWSHPSSLARGGWRLCSYPEDFPRSLGSGLDPSTILGEWKTHPTHGRDGRGSSWEGQVRGEMGEGEQRESQRTTLVGSIPHSNCHLSPQEQTGNS